MSPEVKSKWLEGLRSGKYRQCFDTLTHFNKEGLPDSFCSLGVLKQVDPEAYLNIDDVLYSALVIKNDVEKKSFYEIADWIEENL